jgi:hypothetical protein
MPSIEEAGGLLKTCLAELARLLAAFEEAPTSSGLSDTAAVAEMLVLSDGIPSARHLRQMVCDAAGRWLRLGLLDEFCYARVELVYPAVLLAYMARQGESYSSADMTIIKRLCEGRLIARSEVPVLTQHLIAAYLTHCGVDTDFGDLGRRDLVQMVDKRALRARSDEYDLLVVLMCAQLLRLEHDSAFERPALYPQLLLAQAIRSGHANWLPVLTFLCERCYSLDDRLRGAALESMLNKLPPPGELLPAPQSAAIDGEYISRASRGLRIRSTMALLFSLGTLGEINAEDRAYAVIN